MVSNAHFCSGFWHCLRSRGRIWNCVNQRANIYQLLTWPICLSASEICCPKESRFNMISPSIRYWSDPHHRSFHAWRLHFLGYLAHGFHPKAVCGYVSISLGCNLDVVTFPRYSLKEGCCLLLFLVLLVVLVVYSILFCGDRTSKPTENVWQWGATTSFVGQLVRRLGWWSVLGRSSGDFFGGGRPEISELERSGC